jgi:hypothetical protein
MAAPTKRGTDTVKPANIDGRGYHGYVAGEDLIAGDIVFLHTDGKFYKADASADDVNAQARGVVAKLQKTGEGVSVYYDVHMGGFTSLTPGGPVFLGNTPGVPDLAAGTVVKVIGLVIDSETIHYHFPMVRNTV